VQIAGDDNNDPESNESVSVVVVVVVVVAGGVSPTGNAIDRALPLPPPPPIRNIIALAR